MPGSCCTSGLEATRADRWHEGVGGAFWVAVVEFAAIGRTATGGGRENTFFEVLA